MSKINKFRVWDKMGQSYFGIKNHPTIFQINHIPQFSILENFKFEQFIGIKDINAREIYEGDIIEYTEKMCELGDAVTMTGVVKYDETFAAYGIAGGLDKDCNNYFTDMTISNFCVVGNVNENMDLI